MSTTTSTQTERPLDSSPASEHFEHRRFMTWAGWSGLVASAAYIMTIVATNLLGSVEPSDGPDDIIRYLQDVGDNSIRSYVYGIAGIVMSILFIPYGVAVYSKLHRGAAAGFGSLAMVVGLVMLVPAYAVSILEASALASAATDLGAGSADTMYALLQAGDVTAGISFTVGSVLTLCLAPLLWAIDGRRSGALPTWLNRTGLLVGVTGLVWFVWLYENPVLLIVLLVNVVASLVFFIALARRLLHD